MGNKMKRGVGAALAATMVTSTVAVGNVGPVAYAKEDVAAGIETQSFIPDMESLPDNDTLFEGYVRKTLYGEQTFRKFALFGNFGDTILTGVNKQVYDEVKPALMNVASGKDSAGKVTEGDIPTEFVVEIDDAATMDEFDVSKVMRVLLVDCPYELYWFDKTEGLKTTTQTMGNKGRIILRFKVADAYAGTAEFTVNGKKAGATLAAADQAKAIVERHKDKKDLEKLTAYKEEICKLVDYNYEAADKDYKGGYGDPWQLIYVFDGVDATKVVCEGYAKAFQYLCDLSQFRDSSFACYTVDGLMGGGTGAGGHMWNIVTLGGENYLVDITNSDDGSAGYDGSLFMAWTTDGSVASGYKFEAPYSESGYINYEYDDKIVDLYGDRILTIADSEYVAPVGERVTIKTQPQNPAAVTYGYQKAPEMKVTAEKAQDAAGPITYQWYNEDKTAIQGATEATYAPENLDAGTYRFYCAVSCDGYTVNSNTVTVTVNKAASVVSDISRLDKTYDKTAVEAPEYTKTGNGAVTVEYKAAGEPDSAYKKTAPVNAGKYTVRVSVAETKNYKAASAAADFEIAKKAVTIENVSVAATKQYDGTTTAAIKENGSIQGLHTGDALTIKAGTARYADKNAGAGKTVTFDGFGIEGAAAGNYRLSAQPKAVTADITEKPLTVTVKVKDKRYDGTKKAEIESAALNGVVEGDDIVLQNGTAEFASAEIGENIAINFVEPFAVTGADKGNYTFTQPTGVTASIGAYVAEKGTDYTVNSNDWRKEDFVVTAGEGKKISVSDGADAEWKDSLSVSQEGAGELTFYVKNVTDNVISLPVKEAYKIDKTAPDGDISYNGASVKKLIGEVAFEQLFNKAVNVKIEGTDALGELESVSYYISQKILTEAEVKGIKDWKEGTELSVAAKDQDQFVVYVKVADKAGNITYFASTGSEFDTSAPVISGIKDGETYYATRKVTVDDKHIASVTVNGEASEHGFTIAGTDKDTTYTIVARDQVGNEVSCTVTMKPLTTVDDTIQDLNVDNVTSENKAEVERVLGMASASMEYATAEEKAVLSEVVAKCNSLLARVSVMDEVGRITNELGKYSQDSLKKSDKAAIEQLVKDVDALLAEATLKAEERTTLEDMKKQAEVFLKVIAALPEEQKEEQKPATTPKEDGKEDSKGAPHTGDVVSVWGWLAGLAAAGATILGTRAKGRKAEDNQDN